MNERTSSSPVTLSSDIIGTGCRTSPPPETPAATRVVTPRSSHSGWAFFASAMRSSSVS